MIKGMKKILYISLSFVLLFFSIWNQTYATLSENSLFKIESVKENELENKEDLLNNNAINIDTQSVEKINNEEILNQDVSFSITIPKVVTLNGGANKNDQYIGEYKINVNGNLTGEQFVNVLPDSKFWMYDETNIKSNICATITQNKYNFYESDMNFSAGSGVIVANDMTAGNWSGSFNFEIKYFSHEHQWEEDYTMDIEPTCLTNGLKSIHCTKCSTTKDAITIDAIGHDYEDWTITTPPTCISNGLEEKICKNCKNSETRSIAKLGHNFSTEYTIDVNPTCETMGSKSQHCSRCNEKQNETPIAAIGHNYGDWIISTQPTCISDGLEERICKNCSKKETRNIAKLGHNFSTEYTIDVNPTCETTGSKSQHCSRCNVTQNETIIDALGHDYGDWAVIVDTSCTKDGEEQRVCKTCGNIETNVISKLNHNFSTEYTIDVEPTCETTGLKSQHCSRCNVTQNETVIVALGHSYGNWIVTKQVTCVNDGEETRTCEHCGKFETRVITKLGHDFATIYTTDIEPTCKTTGLKSQHCSRCTEKQNETIIEKLNHEYYDWVTDKEATCLNDGLSKRTCKNCGNVETKIIPKLGHNFDTNYTIDIEPTCETTGLKSQHCLHCDVKQNETIVEALGHDYENSVITIEPTCTSNGSKQSICKHCHNILVENIDMLGHDFSQVKGKVEATCTTSGYGYSCCSRCGIENTDSSSIIRVEPLGHIYKEEFVPPTCTSKGYTMHTCSRCGDYYMSNELSALGHDYELIASTKADCNTKGSMTYKCRVCENEKIIETEVGEHTWDDGAETFPDCEHDGYITHTCLICGETKIENGQVCKGHDFDDGVIITPASCESYGLKQYTCRKCGFTKDEEIPMYGHMYYGDSQICSICGESIVWNFTLDEINKTMKLNSLKTDIMPTLTNIIIPSKAMINDTLYDITFAKSTYDKLQSVNGVLIPVNPKGPFVGNTVLEYVTFEKGATIENNDMSFMFCGCTSLKEVQNIPDSVTIMNMTFESCTSLQSIPTIPSNVEYMIETFKFDTGLTDIGEVYLPEKIKTLAGAFHTCSNMSGSIYILARNIDTVSQSDNARPFQPCYRAFYNCTEKLKVCVYKFNDQASYEARTSDGYADSDAALYTETFKQLYHAAKNIYYYTDKTYSTRATSITDWKANYTSNNISKAAAYIWQY